MNDQDKTKEELITELQELQSKYNSLKELWDLNIAEKDHLEQPNNLLNTIIKSTTGACFVKDLSGKYKFINDAGARMLGNKAEDIIGHTDFELLPPETAREFQKTDEYVISSGQVYDREEMGIIGGKQCFFSAHKTPWRDNSGNIIGIIGISNNITERKQNELLLAEKNTEIEAQNEEYLQLNEELVQTNDELQLAKEQAEESKQKYEQLIENLHVGIIVHAPDTSIVLANSEGAKLLNLSQDQLKGKTAFDPNWHFCDENGNRLKPEEYPVEKVISTKAKLINQVFGINSPQSPNRVWVEVNAYPEFDANHQLHEVVITIVDITERRANENALKRTKLLLTDMGHIAKVGGWEFDAKTGKGQWTEEVAIIHDLPPAIETNVELGISFYVNDSKDKIEKAVKEAVEHGTPYDLELEIVTAKGTRKWIRTNGQVEKKDGQVIRVFGSMQDITELVLVNQKLVKAKEKAEESDQLKTAFLQNMSHEIRTPMNAIMGFSDLLVTNYNNKPKLEKFAKIISQRCNDLLDIISDILDIAKIESGQLPINLEECNLGLLFSELTTFFKEQQKRINKQHIQFTLQTQGNASNMVIIADKVKLRQIFINLIGNAFKFTDTGTIKGGCKFDANHNLIFYVSDTGIGIPSDKQNMVFERFSQLNQGINKATGGTGLGLPIVKGLVKLLGGDIWLESEPAKGSTFTFTIPYKTIELNEPIFIIEEEAQKYYFPNKTILIVEDDYYNAEYLGEVLANTGVNTLYADCGNDAIDISLTQSVDLVLMDIRLPDINGYEVTRAIEQHKPQLKIIAQTAYASTNERQKAIEAGCIDYISKPTKREVLMSMLNKYLTTD